MGDDLTVVNAARVSFDKESEWSEGTYGDWSLGKVLFTQDEKLIHYLARNNHWTPFSHATITLRETIPIFVARQRFKHMVGFTYNEISRRYVDDLPEFWRPDGRTGWRGRAPNKKQGSSDEVVEQVAWTPLVQYSNEDELGETIQTGFQPQWFGDLDYRMSTTPGELLSYVEQVTLMAYTKLLEGGVAPELARMVLPQSMYTSFYVTGSLAAFARAYKLRTHPHAQAEIRELAEQWDAIIRPLYPVSWEALTA